jgi:UDP-2-acetamido-2,6-beta-L-arabino-hexul-4-ose reductase
MRVLVTGADGFIAKNLIIRLQEIGVEIVKFTRKNHLSDLQLIIPEVDFIFHLSGVNRTQSAIEFSIDNYNFTAELCKLIKKNEQHISIVYTSSVQAEQGNPYGVSKLQGEEELLKLVDLNIANVAIYRLPNVFGKWSKPNYNSVVATFCYNTIYNIPLTIRDTSSLVNLVYIDDLIDSFLKFLQLGIKKLERPTINNQYLITVGKLAEIIQSFKSERKEGYIGPVGTGLIRALYSTYLSFYQPKSFKYGLEPISDLRGKFVEIFKTADFGQVSFFTIYPGMTRGGHYHHTKNEKFIVAEGSARFKFRHIISNETYEIMTNGKTPEVVETIPGWSHDITNIGTNEMIVIIWANEVFDKKLADTIPYKV